MAKSSRRRRGPASSMRLDRVALRGLIEDGSITGMHIGVVRVPPGESTHFEVVDGDVLVEVEVMPHGERVTARLGAIVGGPTKGVWVIPDVETEVVLAWPGGEFEADALIVAVLASGGAPEALELGKVIIIGAEVLVYDADANEAVELAYKSDVQAVVDAFNGHIHADSTTAPTSGPVSFVPPNPGTPPPTHLPPVGFEVAAPDPEGTTILKAK